MESRGPYNPCRSSRLDKTSIAWRSTELLLAWRDGDEDALKRLTPLVYDELHRLAGVYMARERPGHPLQARRS